MSIPNAVAYKSSISDIICRTALSDAKALFSTWKEKIRTILTEVKASKLFQTCTVVALKSEMEH